ncbi:MAG: hypothetical protein OER92_09485, partial [Alphaproteobacteria bacterium]|nr:hypothetical protein [Alphaproteobacteria bacterium]
MSGRFIWSGLRRRRGLSGSFAVPVLALVVLISATGVGYAAEQVVVRTGIHKTFGRLVFDWSAPVPYQVAVTDEQITITFERAMEGSFERALAGLPDYIGAARLDDGGKRVVIGLKQPVRPRHFMNKNSVVIDLHPTGGAKAAGKPTPQVPVHVANRDGYTRIVFDWPVRTDYQLTHSDDNVSLKFERPGDIAVPDSVASVSPRVTTMQSARRDDGTPQVDIGIAGQVRHFRDGRKVVVDIIADEDTKPKAVKDPVAPQKPPPAAPAASNAPASDPKTDVGEPVQLVPEPTQRAPAEIAALPEDAET